jgi:nucleolar protein 9
MESLFLGVTQEVEDYLGFLMADTHATHPLRILLLVLAGKPIDVTGGKAGLHSRKKERVTVMGADRQLDPALLKDRQVPPSFTKVLESFIVRTATGDDITNNLQAVSSNPVCSPTLQLLLRLETGQYGKNKSLLLKALIPEDPLTADSRSAPFITNALFDTVSSRLLETVIEVGSAKNFRSIYKFFIKERIANLAKNDIGSFVLCTAMTRIGKDELDYLIDVIVPEVPTLVARNKLNVIRTVYERAVTRQISTTKLESAITEVYAASSVDPENPLATLDMTRMLHLSLSKALVGEMSNPDGSPMNASATRAQSATNHHAAALVSTILSQNTPLATAALNSLAGLPNQLMLSLATSPASGSALSAALTSPAATAPLRRKLVAKLYGQLGSSIALSPAGASILLDGVWPGTRGIAFVRERVAEELAENEGSLKASACGKRVWKGWGMESFRRRRREWEQWSRGEGGSGGGFVGFPEFGQRFRDTEESPNSPDAHGAAKPETKAEKHMSALERARQRHMMQKARKQVPEKSTPVEAV